MGLREITSEAVLEAIQECEAWGRDAFLAEYGFRGSRSYILWHEGKEYDSKAIAGAAHGKLSHHDPLDPSHFRGGERTVATRLRGLGFVVQPMRAPAWARDEVILACDLVHMNEWNRKFPQDPDVIELSELLQCLPLHPSTARDPHFRNANGVAHKIADLITNHPSYDGKRKNGGAVDKEVIQDFLENPTEMHAVAQAIREGARTGRFEDLTPIEGAAGEETEAVEGRLLARQHFARERDPRLRSKKIKSVLTVKGKLQCETCGFDFEVVYGDRGAGYIECHHTVPLHSSGKTVTRLQDLVLLCANCHRMVHRGTRWLTPGELRTAIQQQRELYQTES